jgi:modification methylase
MPLKSNTIYKCDCRKGLSQVDDNSIRLIITSPPYFDAKDYSNKLSGKYSEVKGQIGKHSGEYNDYLNDMLDVWKECERVLMPNGKLCINTPILPMSKANMNTHYNRDYLNINNDIEYSILNNTELYRYSLYIWDKGPTSQLMFGSYPYPPNLYDLNTVEFINVFVKDGDPIPPIKEDKENSIISKDEWREYISQIWKINPENDRSHPAPFPLEIPRRLIKMFSFSNDIIIDPFMGSGTTAMASVECGRKYIGFDLNEEYIKMANKRISSYMLY